MVQFFSWRKMIHGTPQKISKRCKMLIQVENALFEYIWGSEIFGNSVLAFWCIPIDKLYCNSTIEGNMRPLDKKYYKSWQQCDQNFRLWVQNDWSTLMKPVTIHDTLCISTGFWLSRQHPSSSTAYLHFTLNKNWDLLTQSCHIISRSILCLQIAHLGSKIQIAWQSIMCWVNSIGQLIYSSHYDHSSPSPSKSFADTLKP